MSEATKLNGCHVMAKPTGSICNIDCTYCFYLEKEKLYPDRNKNWKMNDSTLERYIKQQIEAQSSNEVVFAWQGGEPTLMGIEFFQLAMDLQKTHNKNGKRIINTFQTNGILLNDEWCEFFKKYNYLVGISIDGPKELHDLYRVNRSGKSTHDKVIKGIELLRKHHVEFNTLTVVNNINVNSPEKVYQYLKSLGSTNIQFIPLIERRAKLPDENGLTLIGPDYPYESNVTEWSVDSLSFGRFLCAIFSSWVRNDIGKVWVQMFEQTFAAWCEQPAQICIFAENCGSALALESNGDVYSCDHFVYPEYKLGNIHDQPIVEMYESQSNLSFGKNKSKSLPKECISCEFKFACHGGCPKHRFIPSVSGGSKHNYLCLGYKEFFKHSKPFMIIMRDLWQSGYAPKDIMNII
ncbi:anaerobic sulfatase maturase [Vibrio parahaemolyticus]|nr:anaerobic sulfatase maturase [Vibrio parahaemolyticus]